MRPSTIESPWISFFFGTRRVKEIGPRTEGQQGNPVTWEEARKLVLANYQVPEEIKQARRRRTIEGNSAKLKRRRREMVAHSTHEAAEAPQPVVTTASPA